MKTAIAGLLGSKKFLAAVATIVGLVLARWFGVEIADDTLMQIIGAVGGLYIAAQGAADHGKHAAAEHAAVGMARVKAANGSAPDPK